MYQLSQLWDQAFSNLEYEYVAGFVQSGSCLHANLHYAIVLSKNVIPFYPIVSQYYPLTRDHTGPIPWLPYGSKQYLINHPLQLSLLFWNQFFLNLWSIAKNALAN
jgi:hypothetical protein